MNVTGSVTLLVTRERSFFDIVCACFLALILVRGEKEKRGKERERWTGLGMTVFL